MQTKPSTNQNYEQQAQREMRFTLESLRKRLLQLTLRNRLLNYTHPIGSSIRVIDEVPTTIVNALQSGKSLVFQGIPDPKEEELRTHGFITTNPETLEEEITEPTEEEWAKLIGINTSNELTFERSSYVKRHSDKYLQTKLYNSKLEARLRRIRGESNASIEETGSNILYLAIGFLEWYESDTSQKAKTAPLITFPVEIKRQENEKKGIIEYAISLKDEDIFTNITLREKLAHDFDILLPKIEEVQNSDASGENADTFDKIDDISPEDYFTRIEEIIKDKKNWKVRRQASLVLLSFAKQIMYDDLHPDNWKNNQSISLLTGGTKDDSDDSSKGYQTNYQTEYTIDNTENIHERFPLVYDADSSQHSALIDAVDGKNIVIEGPPGTGKSQTITNIISACINDGKRVLFVAEKMAALNVVKSRLEQANLGDFCLELHSHKSNKKMILESLSNQLNNRKYYQTPEQLDITIAEYEERKQKLNDYALLINSKWKDTGLTIHQILSGATRYRKELEILKITPNDVALSLTTGLNGNPQNASQNTSQNLDSNNNFELSAKNIEHIKNKSKTLVNVYNQLLEQIPQSRNHAVRPSDHYWYGTNKNRFIDYESDQLTECLTQWNNQLQETLTLYQQKWQQQYLSNQENKSNHESNYESNHQSHITLDEIKNIHEILTLLPILQGNESFEIIPKIANNPDEFKQFINSYQQIHQHLDNAHSLFDLLPNSLSSNSVVEQEAITSKISQSLKKLIQLTAPNTSLKQLSETYQNIESVLEKLTEIDSELVKIQPHLPPNIAQVFVLTEQGFQEILTLVQLIKQLPKDHWQYKNDLFDNPDIDTPLQKLSAILNKLQSNHSQLTQYFTLNDLPNSEDLQDYLAVIEEAGFFRFLSSDWRFSRDEILTLCKSSNSSLEDVESYLPTLLEYKKQLEQADLLVHQNPILTPVYQGVDTPTARLVELRKWYQAVRNEYGVGFGDRVALATELFQLDRSIAEAIVQNYQTHLVEKIESYQLELNVLKQQFTKIPELHDTSSNHIQENSRLKQVCQSFGNEFNVLKEHLSDQQILMSDTTLQDLQDNIEIIQSLKSEKYKFNQLHHSFDCLLEDWHFSLEQGQFNQTMYDSSQSSIQLIHGINQATNDNPKLRKLIINSSVEYYQQLLQLAKTLAEQLNLIEKYKNDFQQAGKINFSEWYVNVNSNANLQGLIERNYQALNHTDWLTTWAEYIEIKQQLASDGLGNIVKLLEEEKLAVTDVSSAVKLAIYHQLAKHEISIENKQIQSFKGATQTDIQQQFKAYDQTLKQLQQQKIAFNASQKEVPAGIATGNVGNFTESALIQHYAPQARPRITIRNLLDRASDSIQSLKPCFMMSPMSVAQYLKPNNFEFDVVIMDEASQILPEDAIGSIARGKSVVIVGDPKQLPPTNFFQNSIQTDGIGTDTDDSDVISFTKLAFAYIENSTTNPNANNNNNNNNNANNNANKLQGIGVYQQSSFQYFQSIMMGTKKGLSSLEESESILDAVQSLSVFNTRRLRWHYRSRHESLIAFSNKHFYDSSLIIFPSPMQESKEFGIRFKKVDGRFNEGLNPQEAREIVQAVCQSLKNDDKESIGIVAMNVKQRDLIESLLEQEMENDFVLKAIVDKKAESEPVFVKNLENVQGDERDVIYISMTYGPSEISGRMHQRFGPINNAGGWRRLNVLFTRSKKRMHVFSSMQSSDVLTDYTSSRGKKSLRAFLEYCETGHLQNSKPTGKEPDSDFEIGVMNAFAKYGYECEPQLGVAGFFLDLAVRNPNNSGQFLIGVECDGATYHSSKSARDRDRLRQEILEGLGWEIHRIWSTDWFTSPDAQLQPILKRLEVLKVKYPKRAIGVVQKNF